MNSLGLADLLRGVGGIERALKELPDKLSDQQRKTLQAAYFQLKALASRIDDAAEKLNSYLGPSI